ncbi:MAG: DUF2169 domain-containing protein [Polyangiaceae bacterium]|nr:DUF2169 domain-containing protein [Polyangiaceae bacterium]
MTLANNTPYAAEAIPFFAPDGREIVLVVVKATFARVGQQALRAERQMPVRLVDLPHVPAETGFAPNGPFQPAGPEAAPGDKGPPLEVSPRYPSDVAVEKRGMDVVFVADAVSRSPVRSLEVGLSLGPHALGLRVHGERVFERARGGLGFGPAVPFERRPLVWELAYGGTSDDFATVERQNPVGRGLAAGKLDGKPAPCIEEAASPLSPGKATEPAGVGAVPTHWSPRAEHAGTFDQSWLEDRMPLAPHDYDVRAGNVAAPKLQLPEPLAPGAVVAALGVAPEGLWSFALPELALVVRGRTKDGRLLTVRPRVDTLLCEPDQDRIELTARAVFPMGRGRTLLAEVMVDV